MGIDINEVTLVQSLIPITASLLLDKDSGAWFGLIPAAGGLANLVPYIILSRAASPSAS
ncbi:MAG: hypothetical protein HKM03_00780 [Steroidobacteraceae bacterium]|nr:hypothetical protein [Steroidobacteraceae bacterium]